MLALPHDSEASLFERSHGPQMIDASDSCHKSHHHFDAANVRAMKLSVQRRKIIFDCIADVGDRFFFGIALGPAARQAWYRHADPFFGVMYYNFVVHRKLL